jgi:hypothetical protein
MIAAILFIPLSLISLLLPVSAAQSCYYPNATLSTDTPCNTTKTGHSACCTAQCMTSGLCFDNGLISRGSCTDPDWKDSSCPQYCTDCMAQWLSKLSWLRQANWLVLWRLPRWWRRHYPSRIPEGCTWCRRYGLVLRFPSGEWVVSARLRNKCPSWDYYTEYNYQEFCE